MDGRRTVAILLCILWAASAGALDHMGLPKAELEQGQISLGFDYSFSREDVEADGSDLIPLFGEKTITVKDVESNRYYGRIGYGLMDWCELFVRLGVGDADADDGNIEFNTTDKFAWGYGAKLTLIDDEKIDWGGLWQMSWLSTNDADSIWATGVKGEYDGWDMQIAAGPVIDMDGWFLYGGAFYYMLDGDFDGKSAGVTVLSVDIEQESEFGGYIGAQLPLVGERVCIGVDFALTADGYSVSSGLVCKF